MGMLVCIAIVSNFSFVAYRLYVPFFDEVSQIPVNCGKANTLVEEFFVKVLGCWDDRDGQQLRHGWRVFATSFDGVVGPPWTGRSCQRLS